MQHVSNLSIYKQFPLYWLSAAEDKNEDFLLMGRRWPLAASMPEAKVICTNRKTSS
jgi:hypothetical protein